MLPRQRTRWQPDDLDQFIGERGFVERVGQEIFKAIRDNVPLPHMLLAGYPGLGKATLAKIIATRINRRLLRTTGANLDPAGLMELLGRADPSGYDDQFRLIDPVLARPWIMLIEDAHALNRETVANLRRVLYPDSSGRRWFMAPTEAGDLVRCGTTAGTVIFSTCQPDRFTAVAGQLIGRDTLRYILSPYSTGQMVMLVKQYAFGIGMELSDDAASALACRSGGVPRIAVLVLDHAHQRAVQRMREGETDKLVIDVDLIERTCERMTIDV